jgi:hypothetical protein
MVLRPGIRGLVAQRVTMVLTWLAAFVTVVLALIVALAVLAVAVIAGNSIAKKVLFHTPSTKVSRGDRATQRRRRAG